MDDTVNRIKLGKNAITRFKWRKKRCREVYDWLLRTVRDHQAAAGPEAVPEPEQAFSPFGAPPVPEEGGEQ